MAYLAIFLAAVAWSAHRVGMCGGFALALTTDRTRVRGVWRRQMAYHAGKTFTYVFLGSVALRVGLWLRDFATWLSVVAGVLLVGIGLQLLGVWQRAPRLHQWLGGAPFCDLVSGWMRTPSVAGAFGVGLVNGLLPCPLVYAMMAYAATLSSWGPVVLTMITFGAGTMPALLAVGLTGGWLGRRWPVQKVSGYVLIGLGTITSARGFEWMHRWLPGACCH